MESTLYAVRWTNNGVNKISRFITQDDALELAEKLFFQLGIPSQVFRGEDLYCEYEV